MFLLISTPAIQDGFPGKLRRGYAHLDDQIAKFARDWESVTNRCDIRCVA
jgi:hypothetical protein